MTTNSPYERLQAFGLSLLTPARPVGTYVPFKLSGNMLYLSGQGPRQADGRLMTGKVGRDLDVAQAYEHARLGMGSLPGNISVEIDAIFEVTRIDS